MIPKTVQDTLNFFSQPEPPSMQIKFSKSSIANQLFSPEWYQSTGPSSSNFFDLLNTDNYLSDEEMDIDGESTTSQDGHHHYPQKNSNVEYRH